MQQSNARRPHAGTHHAAQSRTVRERIIAAEVRKLEARQAAEAKH